MKTRQAERIVALAQETKGHLGPNPGGLMAEASKAADAVLHAWASKGDVEARAMAFRDSISSSGLVASCGHDYEGRVKAAFDESRVNRDAGKFSSKPGAGAAPDEATGGPGGVGGLADALGTDPEDVESVLALIEQNQADGGSLEAAVRAAVESERLPDDAVGLLMDHFASQGGGGAPEEGGGGELNTVRKAQKLMSEGYFQDTSPSNVSREEIEKRWAQYQADQGKAQASAAGPVTTEHVAKRRQ